MINIAVDALIYPQHRNKKYQRPVESKARETFNTKKFRNEMRNSVENNDFEKALW